MKVLIVMGTSDFDLHDLCDALKAHRVDCIIARWNKLREYSGHYDLAVLFGLSPNRDTAYVYARSVRDCIGPHTPFLVVSHWNRDAMARHMKEKFNASYEVRGMPILNLLDTVLDMLDRAKTAPC